MADNFSNSSDILVYFLEGTHLLDLPELVTFRNLNSAVFIGEADRNVKMEQGFHTTVWQSTVVIKCTNSGGIAFVNSSNITFKDITITNCGAKVLDLSQTVRGSEHLCNATLLFIRVASITIDHASIQNGSGFGLLVATDGFEITITSSSFAQNNAFCETRCSGGNVILFYIDPPFGLG